MFEIEVVRFDAQDVIATSSCPNTNLTHYFFTNGKGIIYKYIDGEWVKQSGYVNAPGPNGKSTNGWYEKAEGKGWITDGNGNLKGACIGLDIED